MKILALIPARGGSKRLPGKNIKPLGGRPLIAWTITAALNSGVCTDVIVSTDAHDIADIARSHGASVLGLRPPELSTDTATTADVALFELDRYEELHGNIDALLLLQPTSPFRKAEHVREAAALHANSNGKSVVSVSRSRSHPAWCFQIQDNGMEPLLGWESVFRRSQDLRVMYELNGAIYMIGAGLFRREKRFLMPESIPYVMDDKESSLDIDTPHDWLMAEAYLKNTSDR